MNKIFLGFVSLFMLLTICCNAKTAVKFRKITLAEYDAKEFNYLKGLNIKRLTKGQQQYKPDKLLSNYAQREAYRLASMTTLGYPHIEFLDNYFGYSFQIYGEANGQLGNKQKK